MKRDELFNELKKWLEQKEQVFRANPEEAGFEMPMRGNDGEWQVRVICEEEPSMLQLFCRFPMRVPEEKISEVGLLLHNLNGRLRVGAFNLDARARRMVFRLPMIIYAERPFAEQFGAAFGTAFSTFDEGFKLLALVVSSTSAAKKALAQLNPGCENLSVQASLPGKSRFELN